MPELGQVEKRGLLRAEDLQALQGVRTFYVGLKFDKGVTARAGFQARDDKGVKQLAAYLTKHQPVDLSWEMTVPEAGAEPVDPLARHWLRVDAHSATAQVPKLLSQLAPFLPSP
jgi:hypothetical protein